MQVWAQAKGRIAPLRRQSVENDAGRPDCDTPAAGMEKRLWDRGFASKSNRVFQRGAMTKGAAAQPPSLECRGPQTRMSDCWMPSVFNSAISKLAEPLPSVSTKSRVEPPATDCITSAWVPVKAVT